MLREAAPGPRVPQGSPNKGLRAARGPNASLRGRETEPGEAPGGAASRQPSAPTFPPPAPRGLQPPPAFQIPTAARTGRSDPQQRGKGERSFKSGAEPPPPPQHGGPGLPAAGRGGALGGRERGWAAASALGASAKWPAPVPPRGTPGVVVSPPVLARRGLRAAGLRFPWRPARRRAVRGGGQVAVVT